MRYRNPRRDWMGKRSPCWTALYQLFRIACISYCHRTRQLIRNSLHLLCPRARWNLTQTLGPVRSIWEGGRFIKEEHDIVSIVISKFTLYRVFFYFCVRPNHFLPISVNHRQQNFHSPRSFRSKHISLILYNSVLLPGFIFVASFLWIFFPVEKVKLSS